MVVIDKLKWTARFFKYAYMHRRFIPAQDTISCVAKRFIRNGDVVLDIGANNGMCALMLSSNVGRVGKVIAFEPNSAHWEQLRKIECGNFLGNISWHPFGLGCVSGSKRFWVDSRVGSQASTFSSSFMTDESNIRGDIYSEGNAEIRRLDDLSIENFNFMKIDVEGLELDILKGGRVSIERNRPIVLFEFFFNDNDRSLLESKIQLISFFRSLKYKIIVLKRFYSDMPLEHPSGLFTLDLDTVFSCRVGCDLLALPRDFKDGDVGVGHC